MPRNFYFASPETRRKIIGSEFCKSRCDKISIHYDLCAHIPMDPFKKTLLIESGITIAILAVLLFSIMFLGKTITEYGIQIVSLRNQFAARSGSLNALASLRSQYSLA